MPVISMCSLLCCTARARRTCSPQPVTEAQGVNCGSTHAIKPPPPPHHPLRKIDESIIEHPRAKYSGAPSGPSHDYYYYHHHDYDYDYYYYYCYYYYYHYYHHHHYY